MSGFEFALVSALASVASAFAALLLLLALGRHRPPKPVLFGPPDTMLEPSIFLFEGTELVDATTTARTLLARKAEFGSEWDRLLAVIEPRIPTFAQQIAHISDVGRFEAISPTDADFSVLAEDLGHATRISLRDLSAEGQGILVDSLNLQAHNDELNALRKMTEHLPFPIWRKSGEGAVVWANSAYLALSLELSGSDDIVWPLPVLFDLSAREPTAKQTKRLELPINGASRARWYDCGTLPTAHDEICFALPADATVRAETALRDFVQTLTKTFAHLSVGLAIFDRQRQLAMFNPVLCELTTLSPDYLSARPSLFAFLDRLREVRLLPEPKDYGAWRQQILDLERAAAAGLYQEEWSLLGGQTYRITGRPHPDGAVAFLIEDISAEVSLTRRFRSQITLGQSVIDALADAVAVFAPTGELVLSNAAYADRWGVDPRTTIGAMTIVEACQNWQSNTLPTTVWGDARDYVIQTADRAAWDAIVTTNANETLRCQFIPLQGGLTMVQFSSERERAHQTRKLRRSRPQRVAVSTMPVPTVEEPVGPPL